MHVFLRCLPKRGLSISIFIVFAHIYEPYGLCTRTYIAVGQHARYAGGACCFHFDDDEDRRGAYGRVQAAAAAALVALFFKK